MNARLEAEAIIKQCYSIAGVMYNSEGKVMSREQMLPQMKMYARAILKSCVESELCSSTMEAHCREIEKEIDKFHHPVGRARPGV